MHVASIRNENNQIIFPENTVFSSLLYYHNFLHTYEAYQTSLSLLYLFYSVIILIDYKYLEGCKKKFNYFVFA